MAPIRRRSAEHPPNSNQPSSRKRPAEHEVTKKNPGSSHNSLTAFLRPSLHKKGALQIIVKKSSYEFSVGSSHDYFNAFPSNNVKQKRDIGRF
jgi:hypothetical protein